MYNKVKARDGRTLAFALIEENRNKGKSPLPKTKNVDTRQGGKSELKMMLKFGWRILSVL
jgi:hypothetical protein